MREPSSEGFLCGVRSRYGDGTVPLSWKDAFVL
jgi:hypothetical protein